MLKSIVPIVAVLMFAVPAIAQVAAAPGATAKLDGKDERISCREETHTGSRIAQSVCRSAAEWKELDEATSRMARQMVDQVVNRFNIIPPVSEDDAKQQGL